MDLVKLFLKDKNQVIFSFIVRTQNPDLEFLLRKRNMLYQHNMHAFSLSIYYKYLYICSTMYSFLKP